MILKSFYYYVLTRHNAMLFVVLYLIVILTTNSCTDSDANSRNLLDDAIIEYNYVESGSNVKSLTIKLVSSYQTIDKYLYIQCHHNCNLVLNSQNDTILYNRVEVKKLPLKSVKIIPYTDLQFTIQYLDSIDLSTITVLFVNPIKKSRIKLERISIIDRDYFNLLVNKYPEFVKSDLPILKINSDYSVTSHYQLSTLSIFNPNSTLQYSSDSTYCDYSGTCKLKIRGQTSKYYPKKGFKIEIVDSLHRNVNLLGMPKEHDWVLHGPYMDISLMRNKIAYDLYRDMGRYAPRLRFCELVVNNEYLGIYLLTESIKVDKNRVNIKKNSPDSNHVKSFIIKIDKGEKPIFYSDYKSKIDSGWHQYFYAVYPKYKNLNSKQKQNIKSEIDFFERALLKDDNSYRKYININSFIDFFILNELAKNIDAYRLSTFIYKNKGGKINIGPVWDFNYSFGLTSHNNGFSPEGWVFSFKAVPFWWRLLLQKPDFKTALIKRWGELRIDLIYTEMIDKKIDRLALLVASSQKRNFYKWDILNKDILPRYTDVKSMEEEVVNIKKWLDMRIKWLDIHIKTI